MATGVLFSMGVSEGASDDGAQADAVNNSAKPIVDVRKNVLFNITLSYQNTA